MESDTNMARVVVSVATVAFVVCTPKVFSLNALPFVPPLVAHYGPLRKRDLCVGLSAASHFAKLITNCVQKSAAFAKYILGVDPSVTGLMR